MPTERFRNFAKAAAVLILCAPGCVSEGEPPTDEASFGSISLQPITATMSNDGGHCPAKWIDASFMMVLCPDGWWLESKTFGHSECLRCVPRDDKATGCRGDWQPAALMFGCAPGHEMVYSADGECKHCVAVPECVDDADCFTSGCAGEVCSNTDVVSICVWHPEYACYEEHYCGCHEGKCGWADDPELQQCIDDAIHGWL